MDFLTAAPPKKKYQDTFAIIYDGNKVRALKGGLNGKPFTGTNKYGTFTDGVKTGPGSNTTATPSDTGQQYRGYVSDTSGKDAKPGAMLLQETEAQARSAGTGSGGSGYGMLASSQPLGSAIDEENRYLRQFGAVLLR